MSLFSMLYWSDGKHSWQNGRTLTGERITLENFLHRVCGRSTAGKEAVFSVPAGTKFLLNLEKLCRVGVSLLISHYFVYIGSHIARVSWVIRITHTIQTQREPRSTPCCRSTTSVFTTLAQVWPLLTMFQLLGDWRSQVDMEYIWMFPSRSRHSIFNLC